MRLYFLVHFHSCGCCRVKTWIAGNNTAILHLSALESPNDLLRPSYPSNELPDGFTERVRKYLHTKDRRRIQVWELGN
jgi:hypothetical protein